MGPQTATHRVDHAGAKAASPLAAEQTSASRTCALCGRADRSRLWGRLQVGWVRSRRLLRDDSDYRSRVTAKAPPLQARAEAHTLPPWLTVARGPKGLELCAPRRRLCIPNAASIPPPLLSPANHRQA